MQSRNRNLLDDMETVDVNATHLNNPVNESATSDLLWRAQNSNNDDFNASSQTFNNKPSQQHQANSNSIGTKTPLLGFTAADKKNHQYATLTLNAKGLARKQYIVKAIIGLVLFVVFAGIAASLILSSMGMLSVPIAASLFAAYSVSATTQFGFGVVSALCAAFCFFYGAVSAIQADVIRRDNQKLDQSSDTLLSSKTQ